MTNFRIRLTAALVTMPTLILASPEAQAGRPARNGAEKTPVAAASETVRDRSGDAGGALRYTIMVAKFESSSQWAVGSPEFTITSAWSEMLTDKLVQSGRFVVIAEKDMRVEGRQEQQFNESDWAQQGNHERGTRSVETGHMTGAQLLVKGNITHIEYDKSNANGGGLLGGIGVGWQKSKAEVNLTLQVIDAQTGQVLASSSVKGKAGKFGLQLRNLPALSNLNLGSNPNLASACEAALVQSVDIIKAQLGRLPWTGKVVSQTSGKVILNRGAREGVAVGQVFVVGEGEQIIDPDSGEVLDTVVTQVGHLQVTRVEEKIAYCVVIDGEPPSKGMTVLPED